MGRLSLEEVVALIDDRSKAVSVIRLGDGESGMFASLAANQTFWPLTSPAWRYRYLMDLPWKPIAEALLDAVSRATVVGTPDIGDKTCASFEGIVHGDTCLNNLNRTLFDHFRGVLRQWFKKRRVGIFYHDTIMARRRYADILGVMPDDFTAQRAMFMHVHPFRGDIEKATKWQQERGVDLALVSGGPAGKNLCVKLAHIGCDAMDVGQALDR